MGLQVYELRWQTGLPALVVCTLVIVVGCVEPAGDKHRISRSQVEFPGYVYPDNPPLVNRTTLGALLARFGCEQTVIWVMGEIGPALSATAGRLAAERDALESMGIRVVGLYAGSPSRWRSDLVPMLKSARANFLCAVVDPPAAGNIAAWLDGDPGQLQPGLCVLNRSQQVVALFEPGPESVKAMMTDLAGGRIKSTSGISPAEPMFRARARLIELSTGRTIASVCADATDLETLIGGLAQQLVATVRSPGLVAVVSFRQVGQSITGGDQPAASLLVDQLTCRGWRSVIPPELADKTLTDLGLTIMEVEFAPSRLSQQVPWAAILVGTLESMGPKQQ